MAIQNFIFGGDAIAKTPEELAKQRAVIQALQANSRAPRNVGEGLNALGDGIVANVLNRRANRAQTEGRESAAGVMEGIFGGMGGGSSPQVPAPASSPFAGGNISEPASPSAGAGNYRDAIASIESAGSGDYAAVGPTHDKLGRALGRYQVMEANIGPWSKEALGREVSADEFMANPALQDAVFDHRFGQYVEKFGPEGAAQAWFGGEGGVGKLGRKDSLGTSIAAYSDKFNNALGSAPQGGAQQAIEQALNGPQVASLDASAGMQPTQLPPITATATEPMALQQPTAQQGANVPINEIPSLMTGSQIAQAAPQAPAGFPMEEMAGMDPQFLGGPSAPRPSVAQALSGPQGAPQQPQQGGQPSIQQLMQASANPWLSDSERQIVDALLQREMQNADPMRKLEMERAQLEIEQMRNPQPQMTAEQQNLQWRASQAGLQPGTPEYQQFVLTGGKQADQTNVTVNTGEGDKFYETLDAENAKIYSGLSESGVQARSKLAQIDRLDGLLARAPQGSVGALKQALGEWGLNTEGLSDIQAAQALINELVPQQRQPGSGPMSDADLALFKQSLTRIINQPGGNQMIINTMRGIAEYQVQMGEIADKVADRSLTPAQAREQIRNLANPLAGFSEQEKAGGTSDPELDDLLEMYGD